MEFNHDDEFLYLYIFQLVDKGQPLLEPRLVVPYVMQKLSLEECGLKRVATLWLRLLRIKQVCWIFMIGNYEWPFCYCLVAFSCGRAVLTCLPLIITSCGYKAVPGPESKANAVIHCGLLVFISYSGIYGGVYSRPPVRDLTLCQILKRVFHFVKCRSVYISFYRRGWAALHLHEIVFFG